MKKYHIILILILGIFFGCQNNTEELIILETTDVHGTLFPYDFLKDQVLDQGFLAAAYVIDSIRSVYGKENVLYIDCGDLLQGNPLADYYNFTDTLTPHPLIRFLNTMQADAFIVGNHDIEQGKEVWNRARRQSRFPWLAANAHWGESPDSTVFSPYVVLERNGINIGILGQITPAIPNWLPEEIYRGITFEDMDISIHQWLPTLQKRSDILIGAFHSGVTPQKGKPGYPEAVPEENAAALISEKYPQFTAILSGHQHRVIPQQAKTIPPGKPVLLMAGKKAEYVGFVKITYRKEKGTLQILDTEVQNIKVSGKKVPRHLLESFKTVKDQVTAFVNTPIGRMARSLEGSETRLKDTPLIDLIHQIQLDKTGAQISLAASFRTRLEIPAGAVSLKSVFQVYPYENTLYKIKMKGKDLLDHLVRSAGYYLNDNGRLKTSPEFPGYNFDMAEGIYYQLVYTKNSPVTIHASKLLNGKKFDPDTYYTVAVNSYRAQQLMKLYNCELLWQSSLGMRDFVAEYIRENSPVSVQANNNWKIVVQ